MDLSTQGANAESWLTFAGAEESVGVRGTVRKHGDRIPWSPAALARDRRARPFQSRNGSGLRRQPSVASSGPPRGAEASLQVGRHRVARVVGLALRFALRAPQGCAPDQANKTEGCRRSSEMGIVVPGASWRDLFRGKPLRKEKTQNTKRANEVRTGTFLKSFGTLLLIPLPAAQPLVTF